MGIVRPGGFSPGTYRFELTADGVSGFCEVVMPLLCSREPRCESWPGGAVVEQSGCALGDPKAQSLPGVSFTGVAPGTIELTVLQDGRRLGNGRFAPVYRKSEPNGPGCGPVCRNAPEGMLALEP